MRLLVPSSLLVAVFLALTPVTAQQPIASDWLATAIGAPLARAIALEATRETDGSIRVAARHERLALASLVLLDARVGGQLRLTPDGRALTGDVDVRVDELQAWHGQLRIADVRATIAIGAERTTVTATGRLGSRPIEFTATVRGRVDRSGWSIDGMDGTVRGDRVLVVDADDVRLRARVALDFTADRSGATIRGEIVAQSGRYLRDVPGPETGRSVRLGPPAIDAPWADRLRLDVRLRSDRALTIDSQTFAAQVVPDLTLGGTAAAPTLDGSITATSGTYFAVTGDIPLERGTLVFYERDPGRPYLDAVAHKRVAGYDVRVSAVGPLDSLSIGYHATPPLPREDVASLLAFGGLRSDLDDRGAAEAAGLLGLRYAYTQLFPRRRGADPTWFDDLVGRLEIETVPARTPQDAAKQIRAVVRIAPNLYIRGERDRYAETNFDLLLRFRLGRPGASPQR